MTRAKQGGFSLIEIMVVIVIIGLMVGVVGPALFGNIAEAQRERVTNDFASIKTALQTYKLDNYIYPTSEQGLDALVNKPDGEPVPRKWRDGGYLEKMPKDPWEREYIYLSPSDNGKGFDIISYGADGLQGGEGDAADISFWDEKEG
ncbi:type II secretion system major pseudopilin GspG [Marinagarivorans cellulosilyticus]|uniref:Type II secretion system core protein G n=1 Tax=Marinagarivorans cellulosilyticus TaxID=2721545 RepID=A0AAN2BLG1_9GAMM|nr:type II secretion system major pseudopilin GspG [Marinagarivorans cellulosilyticus]BCD99108.1 general secretion pathway protein G [Marinagarivorans cellulosilyticus]